MNIPNPKRIARGSAKQTQRVRLALSEKERRVAARLHPRDARAWYRRGAARERLQDWQGARAAYATASDLSPGTALYHARLGRVARAQKSWAEAADCYRRALERRPGKPGWTRALVRTLVTTGDVLDAIDVLDKALTDSTDRPPLLRMLASTAESAARWERAAAAQAEVLEHSPDDHGARYRLARFLERQHSAPAPWGSDDPAAARRAYDEALAHFGHLVRHDSRRAVHAAYRLGLLQERDGDLGGAAESYAAALRLLDEVDASWTHTAVHNWRFRLAYVAHRLDPHEDPGDPRLLRSAVPDPASVLPAGDAGDAAGHVETTINAKGLHLAGFLRHGLPGKVELRVDGELLKVVSADTEPWLPTFGYHVAHDVLADFPARSSFTVSVDGRPLLTTGGATALRIEVPGGTGRIAAILASGRRPAKWGGWPADDAAQTARLEVYQRTKEILETHFGKKLFLFYGTLLGQHRDQGFIPGDDDFDAAYIADATKPKELKAELQETSLRLLELGLDVCFAGNGRMIKTGLDGVWIDVVPVWFSRGRAWSFAVHDLRRDAFEPIRTSSLLDEEVYTPRDPEAFLADNYGPGWRTPDSSFRYHLAKEDQKILTRTLLTPSELRAFTERAEQVAARHPAAGRFAGLEIPGGTFGFR